ncbi:MAG: cob(I)yrinic acid a,c-diamide adenosyltransferase [Parasphingopyxis sp.]|uniref:cob(I)yrinic acid a,c-diamide adenosyltransferase n=1 Tax=Parasphingopyxis sp. TaxID=1920299 RepID=UPI003FA0927F
MVKLTKIYTRTGDDGLTGLVDGSRISKADARMAAIGDVDEANSALGVVMAQGPAEPYRAMLARIQNELFDLGADLATPAAEDDDFAPSEMTLRITAGQVTRLETEMDEMNAALEPLASFILPGGDPVAAGIMLARAVVRRAERMAVAAATDNRINPQALAYVNRLSDHLFVMARAINEANGGDILWEPGATG